MTPSRPLPTRASEAGSGTGGLAFVDAENVVIVPTVAPGEYCDVNTNVAGPELPLRGPVAAKVPLPVAFRHVLPFAHPSTF